MVHDLPLRRAKLLASNSLKPLRPPVVIRAGVCRKREEDNFMRKIQRSLAPPCPLEISTAAADASGLRDAAGAHGSEGRGSKSPKFQPVTRKLTWSGPQSCCPATKQLTRKA